MEKRRCGLTSVDKVDSKINRRIYSLVSIKKASSIILTDTGSEYVYVKKKISS